MKTPMTLGLMALLAACGGSGSKTVVDVSDAEVVDMPNIDSTDDPDVAADPDVMPDAGSPPDPVVGGDDDPVVVTDPVDVFYAPELGDFVEIDAASGRLVIAGVEVDLTTAQSIRSDGARTITSYSNNVITFAQIADGDAFAVSAVRTPGRTPTAADLNAEGRLFSVANIDAAPSGSADFSGLYAGSFVSTGVLVGFRDQKSYNVIGDAALSVAFADRLSESTLTGGIINRSLTATTNGYQISKNYGLDDIVFEDVTIGDDGVFVGTFSGGAMNSRPGNTQSFDYASENQTVAGQIGGANGETVVGVLRATQFLIDTLDEIAAERVEFYESGAFLATSD